MGQAFCTIFEKTDSRPASTREELDAIDRFILIAGQGSVFNQCAPIASEKSLYHHSSEDHQSPFPKPWNL